MQDLGSCCYKPVGHPGPLCRLWKGRRIEGDQTEHNFLLPFVGWKVVNASDWVGEQRFPTWSIHWPRGQFTHFQVYLNLLLFPMVIWYFLKSFI